MARLEPSRAGSRNCEAHCMRKVFRSRAISKDPNDSMEPLIRHHLMVRYT